MQLMLLWDLQELDLEIRALEKQIEEAPALSGVDEASARLEELRQVLLEKEEVYREDQKKLKNLEMRTQKIVEDRKKLNENMYDGTVSSVKELEQMQRKMELLAEEKTSLEEEILILMESVEEQEKSLEQLKTELESVSRELNEKETTLQETLCSLKENLKKLQEKRAQHVERIEPKILDRYNLLAEKHQGQPLAGVEDEICGACRVFISSALRGHLYNPDAMVYCENCGRLLIKF
ncbi:MAG: zinc ribbon domain-containing protein [Bacillota bacterium]